MSDPLPRAVLDSNVIYSRVLHELMGRAARGARLIDLIWSEELLSEAQRILTDYKPLPPHVAARWVGYMRQAFPQGEIDISALDPGVDLAAMTSDPDDQHVCALAIAGRASYLFTFDRGFLRKALSEYRVIVTSPDVFLSEAIDTEPVAIQRIVREQAAAWGGGKPLDELIEAYERAKAPVFAGKARDLIGV